MKGEEDDNGDGNGNGNVKTYSRKQKKQRTSFAGFDDENEESDLPVPLFLADPTLLQCFTCHKTLTISAYQCDKENLHCLSCSIGKDYSVSKFAETFLRSLTTPCKNAKHGCKETPRYGFQHDHEKACEFAQCLCLIKGCNVLASAKEVISHLRDKHSGSFCRFEYRTSFYFPFDLICKESSVTVLEGGSGELFALSTDARPDGIAVTVCRIAEYPLENRKFFYYVAAENSEDNYLVIRSSMSVVRSGHDYPFSKSFLLIPDGFYPLWSDQKLELKIWNYCESNSNLVLL